MSQPQQTQYIKVDATHPLQRELSVTCKKCGKVFKTLRWDKTCCSTCVSLARRVYNGARKYRRY